MVILGVWRVVVECQVMLERRGRIFQLILRHLAMLFPIRILKNIRPRESAMPHLPIQILKLRLNILSKSVEEAT